MVEGAELDSALDQLLLVPVGEDDHRDVGCGVVGAQALQDGEAVELGNPDVHKDDVGVQGPRFFQGAQTVGDDMDCVAVQLELEPVHLSHGCIVLDEEDAYVIWLWLGTLIQIPSLLSCNA